MNAEACNLQLHLLSAHEKCERCGWPAEDHGHWTGKIQGGEGKWGYSGDGERYHAAETREEAIEEASCSYDTFWIARIERIEIEDSQPIEDEPEKHCLEDPCPCDECERHRIDQESNAVALLEECREKNRMLHNLCDDIAANRDRWERQEANTAALLNLCREKIKALELGFDLRSFLVSQREWSRNTFGPGERTEGVVDHIRKELEEILASGGELEEWIDVIILAFDGAWRCGHSETSIIRALVSKAKKNRSREWPDWRTAEPGKAIEHKR